jgi:hypothetical protein
MAIASCFEFASVPEQNITRDHARIRRLVYGRPIALVTRQTGGPKGTPERRPK